MTRIGHSRHPTLSPSRPLALYLTLLFALVGLPILSAAPTADFDVVPPDWMGIAEDLIFIRVRIPTASLPEFRLPHYVSHPEPVAIALATLPAELLAIGYDLPDAPQSLQFVTAMAADPRGDIWFASESSTDPAKPQSGEIYRYSPSTRQWTTFTTQNGLPPDDSYAIAADNKGRIWVGHGRSGVSVYVPPPVERGVPARDPAATNHLPPTTDSAPRPFQNYEVVAGLSSPETLAGPLGERVFDIAVCPQVVPTSVGSGDVWIATSAGLARYSDSGRGVSPLKNGTPQSAIESGHWTYFNRAQGLPSDQAQSLAFAPDGTLYVGTQCDGIAIASPADDYKTWRTIQASNPQLTIGNGQSAIPLSMPTAPYGTGLPTNLINDILVTKSGTVYAATTLGLAESKDHGNTWKYWRGRDYADKVKGLYGGPPQDWQPQPGAWLAEDYITCLAEDLSGNLLIGYRQKGYELVNPATGQCLSASANPNDFITALLPQSDGSTLIGTYGNGMRASGPATPPASRSPISNSAISNPQISNSSLPSFPAGAQPPTSNELKAMAERMRPMSTGAVADYLGEDWQTRGDFVGRYGRMYAVLCAARSPFDDVVSVGQDCEVEGFIGPHVIGKDSLRCWLHWPRTKDPRVLWNPYIGERREAEWDDHGEAYPMSHEGPDLGAAITVPEGIYTLSFYFINPNGHEGPTRLRDYLLELKEAQDRDELQSAPVLARARVRDFWGGAYKQFVVRGPGKYYLRIARNGSFNTICSAVLIDKLVGPPMLQDHLLSMMGDLPYEPPELTSILQSMDEGSPVRQLITRLDGPPGPDPGERAIRLLAYRAAASWQVPPEVLENWRWRLRLWTAPDREAFATMMRRGWMGFLDRNPHLKRKFELGLIK